MKTSTGFNGPGATVEAVETMLKAAEGRIKVKASGGVRNYEQAKRFVEMGYLSFCFGSFMLYIM